MTPRSLCLPLLAVAALLAFAGTASAAPSDIDTSFGAGGVATLPATAGAGTLPTATQADGKVIIGYDRADNDIAEVLRMNPDGTADSTFGTGGKFTLPLAGGSQSWVDGIVAEASGRIIVGGTTQIGLVPQMIVWAVTPAGTLDTSFNGGLGYRLFAAVGTAGNLTHGTAVQPDGDIVLVAGVTSGGDTGAVVQFASSTGALGINTVKTFPTTTNPTSMALQPDGAIVVGALLISGTMSIGITIRFTAAGAWDNLFGTGGGVSIFSPGLPVLSQVYAVDTRADGSIAPSGHFGFAGAVQALDPNGVPNAALNLTGITRVIGPNPVSIFSDGAIVGGQRLLAGGVSSNLSTVNSPFVARFDPSGAQDMSFDARMIAPFPESINGLSVAAQASGHYLLFVEMSGSGELRVIRLMGDYVAPPLNIPLRVKFGSIKSTQTAKKFRKFSGTASGTGLSRVQIAIQRIDSSLLKKSKKCKFVKSSSGATKNVKAVKGKCTPATFLNAKGTTTWSYSLKKALPAGRYKLFVRSVGAGGAKSSIAFKSLTLKKK